MVKETSPVNSVTPVACTSVEVAIFMLARSIITVCRYLNALNFIIKLTMQLVRN